MEYPTNKTRIGIDVPLTQEYFDAVQEEINQKRRDYVSNLNKEEQKNFKIIESFCGLLAKRDIPFILVCNPETSSILKGAWEWNKVYSIEEVKENRKNNAFPRKLFNLINRFLTLVSTMLPNIKFKIDFQDDRTPSIVYLAGNYYQEGVENE